MKLSGVATHATIFTFMIACSGCGFIPGLRMEQAKRHESLSVPIPASGECSIRTQNGNISCVTGNVDKIQVEADYIARGYSVEEAQEDVKEISLEHNDRDGIAEITVIIPKGISGGASLTVTLPRSSALNLATSNGAIDVDGVSGGVQAKSNNGSVRVVNATGEINIQTSNGKLTIEGNALTNVRAKTSNGSVTMTGQLSAGDHEIRTSNGSIEVELRGGVAEVTASTSNGKVTANGEKVKSGSSFRLGSGDEPARLLLSTSNGAIRTTSVEVIQVTAEKY
ncbi:hypothetical protein CA13_40980 [Planctomycetes bacterium CA13]|uniref:DUF4097 domain-containing protein n=1 Tax=Novipirellula herctigrandis TaxID=2527986 RepID=A0A5C5Z611_9BACT|nr:hypothetical protein CA13_40980 [Planctomycetes bacterium CA13]